MDGRDEAHKEWLKQRQQMLNELEDTRNILENTINKAIEFIKQGEI